MAEKLARNKSKADECETPKDALLWENNSGKNLSEQNSEDLDDKKQESPSKFQSHLCPTSDREDTTLSIETQAEMEDSIKSRRIRTRQRIADAMIKDEKQDHPVKRANTKSHNVTKYTIASRVTNRHDRAARKKESSSTSRSAPSRLPLASSTSNENSTKRRPPPIKISRSRAISKSLYEKRTLRSSTSISRKNTPTTMIKSSSKSSITSGGSTVDIYGFKARKSPIPKKLSKSKRPSQGSKKDSVSRNAHKYKKRVVPKKR